MAGSIQRRAKGSWQIGYNGPPDTTGQRSQISETICGSKVGDRLLRERLSATDRARLGLTGKNVVPHLSRLSLEKAIENSIRAGPLIMAPSFTTLIAGPGSERYRQRLTSEVTDPN